VLEDATAPHNEQVHICGPAGSLTIPLLRLAQSPIEYFRNLSTFRERSFRCSRSERIYRSWCAAAPVETLSQLGLSDANPIIGRALGALYLGFAAAN
jgi:hypothetical protein